MIKVSNLAKTFLTTQDRVAAVGGVDFDVAAGEVFVLLGPSGCGKSTTLRCIAGLEAPDGGDVAIDGVIVSSAAKRAFVPAELRRVAMVFQSHAIWPHMSVLDNVAFPLTDGRDHMPKRQAHERARRALQLVRMEGYDQRPATQLSGGQQQRVALARALALEPKVLLMDEPLSNLDAALREHMREELKTLFAELELTVVYVTHDQVEALSLATRIAVMHEGRLLQVGPPEEVYESPANLTVLEFFGNCNLVAGEVAGTGEVQTPLGLLRPSTRIDRPTGSPVTLAVRPDDVHLCSNSDGAMQAIVRRRTFLGDYVILEVTVNDLAVRLKTPRRVQASPGDTVWLRFPPDSWQLVPEPDAGSLSF